MVCFFLLRIYADIFVSEFCLVVTKQHPTVIVTKCIHGIQNTSDSIVQERKENQRPRRTETVKRLQFISIYAVMYSVCVVVLCVMCDFSHIVPLLKMLKSGALIQFDIITQSTHSLFKRISLIIFCVPL